jgi:hypothetical protein
MAMSRLDKSQTSFKAEEITYLDRKSIKLDRMLLNLFELLRYDGRRALRRRRRTVDVESLVEAIRMLPDRFPGFGGHPEITRAWLSNDLLEIMNRDKPGRETVVGPRPFHLNAFKLANPKAVQDYGAAAQIWALLYHADRPLLARLKAFFGPGVDPATDQYDRQTPLDLETLAVLSLADQVKGVDHHTDPAAEPFQPLCLAQGKRLAEDLRKLLAYEHIIPRHVLATYIRTMLGLHLALYVMRLFRLLPVWVDCAGRGTDRPSCPLEECASDDAQACPYCTRIVVDLTEDADSPTAALARASTEKYLEGVTAYVRAVVLINRLKDFATAQAARGQKPARTVDDLLAILADPPKNMDGFFEARIGDLTVKKQDEDLAPLEQAILALGDRTPLDLYVELVCLYRLKNERKHLIDLVDTLAQKNQPGGFLKQSAGPRAPRWFVLSSKLLETLAQIAVLSRDSQGRITSKPILIDEFCSWLAQRYGFIVYAPATTAVPPEEQPAWRANEQALRERLHQIGFFTDLSDAYNSQTIRPRYEVLSHE